MSETLDSSFRTGSGDHLSSRKSYLVHTRHSQSWVNMPKMKLHQQISSMNSSDDCRVCFLHGKLFLEAASIDLAKGPGGSLTEFYSASFITCPESDL